MTILWPLSLRTRPLPQSNTNLNFPFISSPAMGHTHRDFNLDNQMKSKIIMMVFFRSIIPTYRSLCPPSPTMASLFLPSLCRKAGFSVSSNSRTSWEEFQTQNSNNVFCEDLPIYYVIFLLQIDTAWWILLMQVGRYLSQYLLSYLTI